MSETKLPPLKDPTDDRMVSLDAYRGFVMLLMTSAGFGTAHLLKDPAWMQQNPALAWFVDQCEHRKWEGCTLWDLIQPSFMFIVGVAMPYAFARRKEKGDSWLRQFGHVLSRAAMLIFIGLFLDSIGKESVQIGFIRVLQQIAFGYVIAFFFLGRGIWVQGIGAAVILGAHTAAYLIFGHQHGTDPWAQAVNTTKDFAGPNSLDNFGSYLDAKLGLGFNRGGYATFNAISAGATILFGVMTGELFRTNLPAARKLAVLVGCGAAGLLLGWALSPIILDVKRLWTASFAFLAVGWTLLMMAFFYLVVDVWRLRAWAFPLVVVGMNSIAIYVLSSTMRTRIADWWKPFVFPVIGHWDKTGPIIMSLLVVLAQWGFCYWLYRRKIFFRV